MLSDKYNIIENHIEMDTINKTKLIKKIENYFENYLCSDIRVLPPDYIKQSVYFGNITFYDIQDNILQFVKDFLIERRNTMRSFIKKDIFEIKTLNKFVKSFIKKIEYLNDELKTNNVIIDNGTEFLSNLIISDSLIMLFIEEQILLFDKTIQNSIEKFIDNVKSLNLHRKIIKTFSNIYKKDLINSKEIVPLSEDHYRIYKLNNSIVYCNNIKEYYHFVENINLIINDLIYVVFENLIDVIKYNNIYDIELVFNNCFSQIIQLCKHIDEDTKNVIFNNFNKEMLTMINKHFKSSYELICIINILKHTEKLIQNQTYKEIYQKNIARLLSDTKILSEINHKIDILIKEQDKDQLANILSFISIIKNKDIFINNYQQYLIKRQMEIISSNINVAFKLEKIEFEREIADGISLFCPPKLTYKLHKIISDTKDSIIYLVNYQNKTKNKDLNVIITSYNIWDINQTEGMIDKSIIEENNSILFNKLKIFQEYYNKMCLDMKTLIWYPHFGEIIIEFNNQELKMLPIQYMVVELFTFENSISLDKILNQNFIKNYSPKFKDDIIASLIASNLFKLKNNILIIENDKYKNDLIEIFFTASDYATVWEEKRMEELIHTREEIISSVINHILKKESMTYEKLFDYVKNTIDVFDVVNILFVKTIKQMEKLDYLEFKDNMWHKIIY